ncbi:aminotransferase class I/II-fold pyridoxal phosphate-dependent enzyme [Thermomonas sp.]|uniref:MalY/PatB family protein n=1 Tax=Thermomonas sp. TaxID=1971895 RepID=UPI002C022500|nr:aminotransferase class I/II-fold pyridoxal phosphate-dependent enzyme [Thermomonas sp.]HRO63377.1 aminotransferase class I/II-fold pyridoxal phosphate-dependent enzyme [Thermomonas sp.]
METTEFDVITAAELQAAGSRKWTAFPGCIGAFIAEMDFGIAPPIQQALAQAMHDGLTGYLTPRLLQDLGDACAQWQQAHHAWAVAPADVKVMPDVLSALEVVLRHFLPIGTPVVVPVPCYMPFIPILDWVGNPVIQLPMLRTPDGWQMDEAGLEAAFAGGAGVLLLCNPHNPIGKVYRRDELECISAIAGRHGARVFADEIHAPLVFSGQQHVPYAAVNEAAAQQAITAVSASKMWNLAGLKCAELILSRDEDRTLWRRIGHHVNDATSTFGVIAHTAAWAQGEPWRQQVLAYLQGNRDALAQRLARQLPQIAHIPAQGTYLAWLDCRALALTPTPQAFFRQQAKVALTDGGECGDGGQGHVRFNFALPRPLLEQALAQMADAVAAR